MIGRDCDVNLRASNHPEFDAWRWHEYWVPLDVVIEFKRGVYQLALQELSRYIHRNDNTGNARHRSPRHSGKSVEKSPEQPKIEQEEHK